MSEQLRQRLIVDVLRERPFLSVTELAKRTGVSAATVRRDIDKLSARGLALKVHGGIAAVQAPSPRHCMPLPSEGNRDIALGAKTAIAAAAAGLVRDGTSIIIHCGSTCFHFGRAIADRNVRVFTNSMPLAAWLGEHGTCQLTIGGGDLHREPGILFDGAQAGFDFYASQFFVSALGVSAEGLLEANPLLVRFIADSASLANEIVVLADSRKFAEHAPTVALPLSRVRRLVTDDGLRDEDARTIEAAGVDLVIAPAGGKEEEHGRRQLETAGR